MHLFHSLCAIVGTAASLFAQCGGNPPSATLSTRDEFEASFYYGNTANLPLVLLSDWDINAAISITAMSGVTYDQGAGNPVVPNQVGATSVVNVYTCPTTWTGNQFSPPGPGSPWTLVGSGQITVVAWPGESPIVFTTPLAISAGVYGVAIEYMPTTSGPNPGALHTLGVSPNNIPIASDQFISISNQGIQQTGWVSGVGPAGLNLRTTYTAAAGSGYYAKFGAGCYSQPQAFYEDRAPAPTPHPLSNTAMQWLPLGPNYFVIATAPSITTPTSPSITLNPAAASSSGTGNWDDGLSAPITLPFTFNHPGGSTNIITISSNGHVFLDAESSSSFNVCGAPYGSIAPFRDGKPRIAGYNCDLDPTAGGSIHYEVDPGNAFVQITWLNVPEWPTGALNTIQLTMRATGQVDIHYGPLNNTSVANGNNVIIGYSTGNGAPLPPAITFATAMPFTSGDGRIPPILTASARPVLNSAPSLVVTNITPGTTIVFFALGFTPLPAGVSLAPFNMPGCFQYAVPFMFVPQPVVSGQATMGVTVPNNVSLLGFVVAIQGAPLTAGQNPAGILTSNGLCLTVGGF